VPAYVCRFGTDVGGCGTPRGSVVMPGVLVVLLWLAAGGVATWLIGREEIRRVERRAESRSRDKVSP